MLGYAVLLGTVLVSVGSALAIAQELGVFTQAVLGAGAAVLVAAAGAIFAYRAWQGATELKFKGPAWAVPLAYAASGGAAAATAALSAADAGGDEDDRGARNGLAAFALAGAIVASASHRLMLDRQGAVQLGAMDILFED